ncbi:MAG: polysaccharide deacetylase family protein [Bradyrhizobium sp.]|nr:polysaccharide deacetylase family protein [Bradyrhizobium sp.]
MMGSVLAGVRTRQWVVLCLGLLVGIIPQVASAADCPGHPGALGTSRTLVVDPREHPRIGTMQYPETLPLEDHEVVLTFDDGPLPHNSNQILEILASECVKATFFEIGRMARAYPEGVRKLRDAGHSIGTHSENHPLSMNRMPIERARQEIDDGIASVKAALGDDKALAPFFRIPGLLRAEGVEDYLASQGIQTWSADFPADDWRHIPSSRVYDLAIKRIEAKGKGILLLHDIQARTVAALPRILQELKARGYRIVHVVPATPELPATPTEPQQWQLHPTSENVAISHWPKVRNFVFTQTDTLPAPSLSDLDWRGGRSMALADERFDVAGRHPRGVPQQAPWPQPSPLAPGSDAIALPVPAEGIFKIQENPRATAQSLLPFAHHAEQTVATLSQRDGIARLIAANAGGIRGKHHLGGARRPGASKMAGRATRNAAGAHPGTLRHLVQVKKRNV